MVSRTNNLLEHHRGLWRLLAGGILLWALAFRLIGLHWDGGYLFHPDERQILIVANGLSFPWPPDWAALLSPQSPWNPAFFSYGSLSIYLLRVSTWLAGLVEPKLATLSGSYVVGRTLSALADVGTVYLTLRLGRQLFTRLTGLAAAALVAATVLHIQLAHFYTVDTLLTFLVLLTLSLAVDLLRQPRAWRGALVGLAWGMALATKVSAAPLLAPIALAWFVGVFTSPIAQRRGAFRLARAIAGGALSAVVGLVAFLAFQPYAVLDVVRFVMDLAFESQMARGVTDVPYTRQYIGTLPYLYPIWQTVVWSMGVPLGVTGFMGAGLALAGALRQVAANHWRRAGELLVPLSWLGLYFCVVGAFHAKFLRYMLPILPLLSLYGAWALLRLIEKPSWPRWLRRAGAVWLSVVFVASLLYALAYGNVYRQEHPWIQTTRWVCTNLPPGSTLLVEHWDDPLPMVQGRGALACDDDYQFIRFPFYDADTPEKLDQLLVALAEADYVILASHRLYNTIPRLPERYPITSRYYRLLLGERLGYELVYHAASHPRLLGLDLVDDTFSDPALPIPAGLDEGGARLTLGRADESFTVYDHPKTLVIQKVRQLSPGQLSSLLSEAAPAANASPQG